MRVLEFGILHPFERRRISEAEKLLAAMKEFQHTSGSLRAEWGWDSPLRDVHTSVRLQLDPQDGEDGLHVEVVKDYRVLNDSDRTSYDIKPDRIHNGPFRGKTTRTDGGKEVWTRIIKPRAGDLRMYADDLRKKTAKLSSSA